MLVRIWFCQAWFFSVTFRTLIHTTPVKVPRPLVALALAKNLDSVWPWCDYQKNNNLALIFLPHIYGNLKRYWKFLEDKFHPLLKTLLTIFINPKINIFCHFTQKAYSSKGRNGIPGQIISSWGRKSDLKICHEAKTIRPKMTIRPLDEQALRDKSLQWPIFRLLILFTPYFLEFPPDFHMSHGRPGFTRFRLV